MSIERQLSLEALHAPIFDVLHGFLPAGEQNPEELRDEHNAGEDDGWQPITDEILETFDH